MDDQDKSPDFQRGWTAGYQARVREETESYLAAALAGRQIYDRVIRDLVNLKPFSEREADRQATIYAAHMAGIHADGGRQGCRWCVDATAAPGPMVRDGMCALCYHPVSEHVADGCAARGPNDTSGTCLCPRNASMLLTGVPHSGHYGVARAGACSRSEPHECGDDVEYCERCGGYRPDPHRCDTHNQANGNNHPAHKPDYVAGSDDARS